MLKSSTASERQAGGARHRLRYIPGVLVIRWKRDVAPPSTARVALRATALSLPRTVPDSLAYLSRNFGLEQVVDVAPRLRPAPANVRIVRTLARHADAVARSLAIASDGPRGLTVVTLDPRANVRLAARHITEGLGSPVEYAHPAPARWAFASGPADPRYNAQWGLPAIEWFTARRPRRSRVRIALLDTGVDDGHPDLKGVIAAYDHGSFSATDIEGHGTHVAGILAAKSNNSIGIAGVTSCKLLCWKVFSDKPQRDGQLYLDNDAYYAALVAVRHERSVRVLNLSIGGEAEDPTEADLIGALVNDDRILVVAAMGNEYAEGNPVEYPAALPGVLAVGAIDQKRRRAGFSNTGKHIGLMGPGTSILSTLPLKPAPPFREETGYDAWDGTSMATPFVSGAAALVFSRHPRLTASAARARLLKRSKHLAAMGRRARTVAYGAGLVDLRKAL